MNTLELEKAARSDRFLKNNFGGVYACDQLPKYAIHNGYIADINNSKLPGSHWVAMWFVPARKEVYYFDSYGLKPPNVHIVRFLKRNSIFKKYNLRVLQSHCSTVCGQYCLYFLSHRARGFPPERILKTFGKKKQRNDELVVRFAHKLYNMRPRPPTIDSGCVQRSLSLAARTLLRAD